MDIREEPNDRDIQHRKGFADYVSHDAPSEWHREVLDRLYQHWRSINRDHFEGTLVEPSITLGNPGAAKLLGVYFPVGEWGSQAQIKIRATLIDGDGKWLRPGDEYAEGRRRFVEDVELHESVHQYCHEKLHAPEKSYKGHGTVFAGQCTRIGDTLGLPPVGVAKKGRSDLPSCADWPMNVRPADYYLGALADPPQPKPDDGEDDTPRWFPCPFDAEEADSILAANFDQAGIRRLYSGRMLLAGGFDERTTLAIKDLVNAISPLKPEPAPKEEPPARPKRARRVSASGDSEPVSTDRDTKPGWRTSTLDPVPNDPDEKPARPKRRKAVSTGRDTKDAGPKQRKAVSANGDTKTARPKRGKTVSAGGDKGPVFAVGQKVRSTGKGKRKGKAWHATTGVIVEVIDHRKAGVEGGQVDYKIRWDDGKTIWKMVTVGKAGPIEAIP